MTEVTLSQSQNDKTTNINLIGIICFRHFDILAKTPGVAESRRLPHFAAKMTPAHARALLILTKSRTRSRTRLRIERSLFSNQMMFTSWGQ